ncbi:hypothetical protein [Glycomyces harbinensis]|uniref:Uncharacterized protein n=1 Tax=Glycomyces harbinensis TaxID=58114 RepID=A0A1G6YIJ6_9ACTN|nr:hypothetical protein [Glycomyces harbinensis]SDD90209.1 hypothetical protein SAMN05216270_10920 [Glycomyces harbinensis]
MTDSLFASGDAAEEGAGDGAGLYFEASLEAPSFEFTIAFGDTAGSGAERAGCSSAACPHPVAHPAEEDWVQLASAVPAEGQLHRFKPRCEGMAYPTEDDFRAAVTAVRPQDPDAFSLQRLRTGWTDEVGARIGSWPDRLKSRLSALAEGWAGEDFEAFAAQADEARALLEGVIDDIDATTAELATCETAIYTLQGGDSGEIPYPAPMVGVEGEWSNLVSLHLRPAWWHGDCIRMTCEEAEKAMELAGADPRLATDVREFIEERVGSALSGLGALVADVRALAGEEAKELFTDRVAAELAGYFERQAAIDEAIAAKRDGQSEELTALGPTGEDRPLPGGADTSYMDLAAPEAERPSPPAAPRATQDPSPVPPGGDGTVREDQAPQDEDEADDDVAGGLASGGGFGSGPGGAFGSSGGSAMRAGGAMGPGGAGGVPQGLFGPAVTAPVPTAGPAGAGGGAGGGVRPGMAPAHQQGGAAGRDAKRYDEDEAEEDERPQDLTRRETGNLWGYVKPNEDPYN